MPILERSTQRLLSNVAQESYGAVKNPSPQLNQSLGIFSPGAHGEGEKINVSFDELRLALQDLKLRLLEVKAEVNPKNPVWLEKLAISINGIADNLKEFETFYAPTVTAALNVVYALESDLDSSGLWQTGRIISATLGVVGTVLSVVMFGPLCIDELQFEDNDWSDWSCAVISFSLGLFFCVCTMCSCFRYEREVDVVSRHFDRAIGRIEQEMEKCDTQTISAPFRPQ